MTQEIREVIQYIPNKEVGFKITLPNNATVVDRYYFSFAGERTTVKQVTEIEVAGIKGRILHALFSSNIKKVILDQLKLYLETNP